LFLALSFLAFYTTSQHDEGGPGSSHVQDPHLVTPTLSAEGFRFTVPASADYGAPLIPNVRDPEAKNSQDLCPGYKASNVRSTSHGFTADLDLAGPPCNVYGNDIEALTLIFEYQASGRIHLEILPRYITAENLTWFVLPETLIPKPAAEAGVDADGLDSDLDFSWDNSSPAFAFTVSRKCNGDVLFTTNGTKLVFADQFFEFVSPLPKNYNLYGLGEVVHSFHLGNNLTSE
jgi:alpha-glucosidase